MSEMAIRAGEESCWKHIGVWGDRSCPELPKVFDCRNCGIYASRGRRLLDRPAPDGYIESWAAVIAEETLGGQSATSPYLVFRLGQAWFAFLATSLQEVAAPSVIRSVPHRSRDILLGLVNVRGELHPCVSLHTLFGEESGPQRGLMGRLLVARWAGEYWVFPADKVDGIHEVDASGIEPPPVTVSNLAMVYTQGLFRYEDKTVAVINEAMLFSELTRRIA
jgi:chemotaxis-related protein WspD